MSNVSRRYRTVTEEFLFYVHYGMPYRCSFILNAPSCFTFSDTHLHSFPFSCLLKIVRWLLYFESNRVCRIMAVLKPLTNQLISTVINECSCRLRTDYNSLQYSQSVGASPSTGKIIRLGCCGQQPCHTGEFWN